MARKMTQAQLRFLEKVIRTTSSACSDIGEYRAREACTRNGWLRHEPNPRGRHYGMLTYITDDARAIIHEMADRAA